VFVPLGEREYEPCVLVPHALTERQCDRAVALGRALEAEESRVGDDPDAAADDTTRRSRTAWIGDDDDTAWLYGRLTRVVARANRAFGFDLIGFTEDVQFTRYDEPGAFYDWHQDGLAGDVAGRKLSVVVQLTDPDDYAGSDLELFGVACGGPPDPDWTAATRARGTAIVFPAFEHHRVTPLERGARCSLVCWVGGPPFR